MTSQSFKVLLVHMPWGALERPALGLALLEASLRRDGVECSTAYLNMRLADRLGVDCYNFITHDLPHVAFTGDWLFSESLYGVDARRDAGYVDHILRGDWQVPEALIQQILGVRREIEPFLQDALREYDWAAFDLVGFTSTFEQNIASLTLAQRLKVHQPGMRIAFGGANWEGAMGQEYHRCFPFVDYVCSGEADLSFPRLVDAVRRSPPRMVARRLAAIPGIVYRDEGRSVATGATPLVEQLDDLPVPYFDAYFSARETSSAAMQTSPVLLFEASRGCWWGAKSHCTFCGLNGHSMRFRAKSPERLVDELNHLIVQWPCPTIEAVDNILDMRYFESVLPALEKMTLPGPLFFEVKANLKRHHIASLKRANITRIQPGIESLSNHVLRLMRKGTTALQNVQLLKWCREYDIHVDWNLLYGFPGETDDDYEAIIELLPKLSHLQAPGACGPIRLDRFSPYFQDPASFGLCDLEPYPAYRYLYPLRKMRLEQVAYYFRFEYRDGFRPGLRAQEAVRMADAWRNRGRNSETIQALPRSDGSLQLHDSRPDAVVRTLRLSAVERIVLLRIDEVASLHQIMHAVHATFANERYDSGDIASFLDRLAELGLILKEKTAGGTHYLSLALLPQKLRSEAESASRLHVPLLQCKVA
jgi:ribosomal peptide maturation radical SAM protein 1